MGVQNQGHKSLCRSSFANPEILSVVLTEPLPSYDEEVIYMDSSFLILGLSGLSERPNFHVDSDSIEMQWLYKMPLVRLIWVEGVSC
jgi:hypothetical protein